MTAWVNVAVLLVSVLLFVAFYSLSVSPARLQRHIDARAYPLCGWLRGVAMVFEAVTLVNYVIYRFYPLPLELPARFPWPYWVSVALAVTIGLPAASLMIWGLRDAGREAAVPQKDQALYGGIYGWVRHPQAAGEVWLWLVTALLLNSPFLALFSLIWFPIFVLISLVEERDLLIRFPETYAGYRAETGMFWPKR